MACKVCKGLMGCWGDKMKYVLAIVVALLVFPVEAADWKERGDIGALFKSAGINGTFVLYDIADDAYIGYNQSRAETRFVPASTFKIPNTLIGLSVGVVKDVDEVLPYGGQPQFMKAWEEDMGLRKAIALSNVPIYQHLARRIGLERMRENIMKMDYGNKEIGSQVDRFWLDGPLKVSAIEQARFLARLAQGILPFPAALQASVREIVQVDQGKDWVLYGKTGWENAPNPGVGWWVGWVHKNNRIYTFALNMDVHSAVDADKRVVLGRKSLALLGVL
ncbi:class D beta-lactamase [Methylobacillus sp.]|uniref:class D beta-lactamase n=1 Tax=Methylobacillus sp. TaxID=56818 RepID=UPI002579C294|nr:class D beta-lactamase [Methylobacillus sp.]